MAFSGIHKLSLEEALPQNDNPQNRSLIGVFEEDTKLLKRYVQRLFECSKELATAQKKLTSAASSLSEHLKFYELQKFPLDSDEESILTTTVKQFSKTIDDLSSCYQVISSQIQDGMLFPISKFLDADLNEIDSLSEMYHSSINEHDQATAKYSKVSKKKENDKQRQDLNQEYYASSKRLHKVSLNYFAQLNALQYKRKSAIIEPMLAFIHAYKSHFSIGNDSINSEETNMFLSNIGASVQGLYVDLGTATQDTVKQIEALEERCEPLYFAETPKSVSAVPPNTTLIQKAGYLYLRSKFAGMMTKWDRVYVFTQNGNLMSITQGEVGGACILELDFRVIAQHISNEDRRCVFQITNGKRSVVLQALSDEDRDEWIATIRNIVRDEGYVKGGKKMGDTDRRNSSFYTEKTSSEAVMVPLRKHSSSFSEHLSIARSGPPPTPPCSPMDGLILDNPIQFDLLGPNDEEIDNFIPTDNDCRINPFDESHRNGSSSSNDENFTYSVRFLGCMAVSIDRGDRMIYDTMRQVMAARAIYNVFKMTESRLFLSTSSLRLLDPTSHATRISFPMHDISYWVAHKENNRLFGFIARTKSGNESRSQFNCYIFESDVSGEEICNCLAKIAQLALQKIIEQKAVQTPDSDQNSNKTADESKTVPEPTENPTSPTEET